MFTRTVLLAALIALTLAGTSQAGDKSCSNATLSGNYAAVLTGFVGNLPFAALDLATADGNGTLTGSGTSNLNGTVGPAPISATYTINADCTGSATFSNGSTQNLIVTQDGSDVYIIRTGPASMGTVVTGTAHRLSK